MRDLWWLIKWGYILYAIDHIPSIYRRYIQPNLAELTTLGLWCLMGIITVPLGAVVLCGIVYILFPHAHVYDKRGTLYPALAVLGGIGGFWLASWIVQSLRGLPL